METALIFKVKINPGECRNGRVRGIKRIRIVFILIFFFLLGGHSIAMNASPKIWSLLGGSGRSHPGWGATNLEVKTLDFFLRHERPVSEKNGTGLFRKRHFLSIELAMHSLRDLDQPPMIGAYFHSCWIFTPTAGIRPYVFAGGGPVFTQAEIPGTSSVVRGAYGFGTGIRLSLDFLELLLETRYQHISNGGIKKPNDPLNSHKILLGVTLNPSRGAGR